MFVAPAASPHRPTRPVRSPRVLGTAALDLGTSVQRFGMLLQASTAILWQISALPADAHETLADPDARCTLVPPDAELDGDAWATHLVFQPGDIATFNVVELPDTFDAPHPKAPAVIAGSVQFRVDGERVTIACTARSVHEDGVTAFHTASLHREVVIDLLAHTELGTPDAPDRTLFWVRDARPGAAPRTALIAAPSTDALVTALGQCDLEGSASSADRAARITIVEFDARPGIPADLAAHDMQSLPGNCVWLGGTLTLHPRADASTPRRLA